MIKYKDYDEWYAFEYCMYTILSKVFVHLR